jgi:hypothetical protein
MSRRNRRPRYGGFSRLVPAVVVASFAFALFLSCAVHTDDGCPVEFHCFACHWAFAGHAVTTALVPLPTGLPHAGAIAILPIAPPTARPAPAAFSRGPPRS